MASYWKLKRFILRMVVWCEKHLVHILDEVRGAHRAPDISPFFQKTNIDDRRLGI